MNEKRIQSQAQRVTEVLAQIDQGLPDAPADRQLATLYSENRHFGSRDRRLFSSVVFSTYRWLGWTQNPSLSYYLDATERHGAIDFLLSQEGIDPNTIVPAGMLSIEEKAARLAEWTGEETGPIRELFPEGTPELTDPQMIAFQSRAPVWIRCREEYAEQVDKRLAHHDISVQPTQGFPLARCIRDIPAFNRFKPDCLGLFEIQDLGSQAVGMIAAPKKGGTWWDTCCGAGGKSLQLIDMIDHNGRVVATDRRSKALDQFFSRRKKNNMKGMELYNIDVIKEPFLTREFDGILVDAPCSGIGTWARNPDARWRFSENDLEKYSNVQVEILKSVRRALKPDAQLVYSVCTIGPAETTGVVERVLAECSNLKLSGFTNPFTGERVEGGMLQFPHEEVDSIGMFVAVFERTK